MHRQVPELIDSIAKKLGCPPWLRDCILLQVVAGSFYFAGILGQRLAILPNRVSAFWPPSGIALTAILLLGYRFWPGILIGSLLLGIRDGAHVFTALMSGAGHVLEPVVAAYLINKYARGTKAFDSAQSVFRFVFFACIVSPVISASFGMGSYYLSGIVGRQDMLNLWITWWLADACGVMLVAPFVLILFDRPHHRMEGPEIFEFTCLVLGLIFITECAFGPLSVSLNQSALVRTWMLVPFLIWAGFRFCQLEVAGLMILLFGTAAYGTTHGIGTFAYPGYQLSLLTLDSFIGVIGTMSLAIAAMVSERRAVEGRLLGIQSLLQEAVAGSARDLTATVDALHMEVMDHLEAEKALRDSNEKLRLLTGRVPLVLCVYDAIAGKVLYISPAYEAVWGRSCESMYADAHSWFDLVHPDDRGVAYPNWDPASDQDHFQAEYRIVRDDGSVRWIRDHSFAIRDASGRICGMVGITTEIPARAQETAQDAPAARQDKFERYLQ